MTTTTVNKQHDNKKQEKDEDKRRRQWTLSPAKGPSISLCPSSTSSSFQPPAGVLPPRPIFLHYSSRLVHFTILEFFCAFVYLSLTWTTNVL
jgi:hypothetical protein